MIFDIVLSYGYYDIPLQGILQTGSSTFAFDACVLDDEPAELADRPGIYSQIRVFECDDALKIALEEIHIIFSKWRAAFDKGCVDGATHPLNVDPIYQQLCHKVDEIFSHFGAPIIEAKGLMNNASGREVFECLDDISL